MKPLIAISPKEYLWVIECRYLMILVLYHNINYLLREKLRIIWQDQQIWKEQMFNHLIWIKAQVKILWNMIQKQKLDKDMMYMNHKQEQLHLYHLNLLQMHLVPLKVKMVILRWSLLNQLKNFQALYPHKQKHMVEDGVSKQKHHFLSVLKIILKRMKLCLKQLILLIQEKQL